MGEVPRSIFLLKKGYSVQKTSVIYNLHRYLEDQEANEELLPIILESFIDWDQNMQLECGQSFKRVIAKDLLQPDSKCTLAEKALEIIHSPLENDELQDEWTEVFIDLVPKLEMDFILTDCLPKVYPLFAYTQPQKVRVRGTKMLIALLKVKADQETSGSGSLGSEKQFSFKSNLW